MGVKETRWKLKNKADKAYHQEKFELARKVTKSLIDKIYPDLEEEEVTSLQEFIEKKEKEYEVKLRNVEEETKKTSIVKKKTKIKRKGVQRADVKFIEEILGKLDEILIGKSMVPE